TQNLIFPVTVALSQTFIKADGKDVALTPGMTATVEIRTGRRRVIDYLLSPVRETTSTAGHER
ncbi:HlyD family type I secretion periplasmic adaptor subunit, partial [Methylobacterium terricola]